MYINGEEYNLCCGVLLNIPGEDKRFTAGDKESVDYITDSGEFKSTRDNNLRKEIKLSPEEEFWAYCSNLQVWAENNYNTNLLDYSVAFPLLEKLIQIGDPLAKNVYKQEILRRLKYGTYWATSFIKYEGFFEKISLTEEELINGVLIPFEATTLKKITNSTELRYDIGTSFDNDEIRERPLYGQIFDNRLFFTVENGHVIELEIEITEENLKILEEIEKLKYLKILHMWISSSTLKFPQFPFKFSNVVILKVIMNELVDLPANFNNYFPKVKNPRFFVTK